MEQPSPQASIDLARRADLLEPALLRAAATLGVADVLAEGPADPAAVAARVGADATVTAELLAELAARELLEHDGDGDYRLTAAAEPLRSDHPMSVRDLLRNDSMLGVSGLSLLRLDHTVRTGEPAALATGSGYWDEVNHEPRYLQEWRRQAAAADANPALGWGAQQIVDAYDWSGVGHVVDVGGHIGSVLLALLRAHPQLRGTMLDLGHPATVAAERFARSDVAERAEVVDGSFFDRLPPGCDVYVLSAILADWPDRDAVRILRRCAEAAGADGRVLLAEVAMPMDTAATRLRMRSMMPAPDRDAAALLTLAERAGLRLSWRADGDDGRSLLELAQA